LEVKYDNFNGYFTHDSYMNQRSIEIKLLNKRFHTFFFCEESMKKVLVFLFFFFFCIITLEPLSNAEDNIQHIR